MAASLDYETQSRIYKEQWSGEMDKGPKAGMVMQFLRSRNILVSKNVPMREATKCMGIANMTNLE